MAAEPSEHASTSAGRTQLQAQPPVHARKPAVLPQHAHQKAPMAAQPSDEPKTVFPPNGSYKTNASQWGHLFGRYYGFRNATKAKGIYLNSIKHLWSTHASIDIVKFVVWHASPDEWLVDKVIDGVCVIKMHTWPLISRRYLI